MRTSTNIPFTRSESKRLAHLSGALNDLRQTASYCRIALRIDTAGDFILTEAIQAAAIMRYGRSYGGGIRHPHQVTSEMIAGLPIQLQEAHKFFDGVRDKYIAHSVNDWELNIPAIEATYETKDGPLEVRSIQTTDERVVGIGSDHLRLLLELSDSLGKVIEVEMELEKAKLLKIALSLSQIELRQMRDEPPPRSTVNVHKSRKRG